VFAFCLEQRETEPTIPLNPSPQPTAPLPSGRATHVYSSNEWRMTMIEHTANSNGNDWVTSAKLRQQLGDVSPNTVLRWRHDEDLGFPAPTKVNGRNYWRAADLKRWQDEQAAKQNAA
jgi:hypothetical protein